MYYLSRLKIPIGCMYVSSYVGNKRGLPRIIVWSLAHFGGAFKAHCKFSVAHFEFPEVLYELWEVIGIMIRASISACWLDSNCLTLWWLLSLEPNGRDLIERRWCISELQEMASRLFLKSEKEELSIVCKETVPLTARAVKKNTMLDVTAVCLQLAFIYCCLLAVSI